MKQYILSILCLLATFVLPITAQNNDAGTKAAPDAPAMPYKLTTVTIGGNNGTVAVEDNNSGGGGVITVGNDTFAYGASGKNATTVKLTVTPKDGYVVRTGYPKVYKTGDTGTAVTISEGGSPYTFTMPPFPVTVKIAYSDKITSVAAITLKEAATTAEDAVSKLPGFVYFNLSSGRKGRIAVTGWTFKKSGKIGEGTEKFDTAAGAVNRFSYTAATLPDSIVDNDKKLGELIPVANMAEPLKPQGTDKITIKPGTGENLDSDKGAFNGTIQNATVKELEVTTDVKDATLTLSGVTVKAEGGGAGTTTIKDGADLTLKIEGDNNLGKLTVESGATIVLNKSEGASLNGTTIDNAGTFRDSTATVTEVTGTAALSISGNLNGGGSVTTNTPVTLTATTKDAAGETTFIWQRQNADGSYTEVERKSYDDNGSPVTKATVSSLKDEYKPATASAGTTHYRCLIERTVTPQGGVPVTTLLSTQPATVEVKSGGGDTPPSIPVYYMVTLPTVEGFTTAPAAGLHVVEEGYSFSFALTREEGYTGDLPTVTTNRGETIAPRESDGKYIIRNVDSDITISFGSHPTANGAVEVGAIRIWNSPGGVNIHTPQAVATAIYTLSGHCVKQFTAPAGDSRIALPKGLYIVVAGQQQQKVIVH